MTRGSGKTQGSGVIRSEHPKRKLKFQQAERGNCLSKEMEVASCTAHFEKGEMVSRVATI